MNLRRPLAKRLRSALKAKKYDPLTYWNARADPNNDAGRHRDRVNFDARYIAANLSRSNSVLELGPGVGRTFASYEEGMNVTTVDISKNYQDKLSETALDHGLILNQYFLEDPKSRFPFSDKQFDVGVSCQVFIHEPPDIFEYHFAEMIRVCRKVIVSAGIHKNAANNTKKLALHVFAHDYIAEATKNRKILSNVLIRDGAIYFTIEDNSKIHWE